MKITIELTEEAAACLWDDVTWGGKTAHTIGWIVQSYVDGRAALSIAGTPEHYRPAVLEKFRDAHPPQAGGEAKPEPPQPTQSKPDCDCGSDQASWHGEAPDLRQFCCEACYRKPERQFLTMKIPRT